MDLNLRIELTDGYGYFLTPYKISASSSITNYALKWRGPGPSPKRGLEFGLLVIAVLELRVYYYRHALGGKAKRRQLREVAGELAGRHFPLRLRHPEAECYVLPLSWALVGDPIQHRHREKAESDGQLEKKVNFRRASLVSGGDPPGRHRSPAVPGCLGANAGTTGPPHRPNSTTCPSSRCTVWTSC